MARYHKDVYLPAIPSATLTLQYSYHSLKAALDDRYANLTPHLPKFVRLSEVQVIEADTFLNQNGREAYEKLLVRFGIGRGLDLCLVLKACPGNVWLVKTVWANRSDDTHRTLKNREAFEKGPRKA